MLDISTLFVNISAFLEAFLRTSMLHTGPAGGRLMSNIACEIDLVIYM